MPNTGITAAALKTPSKGRKPKVLEEVKQEAAPVAPPAEIIAPPAEIIAPPAEIIAPPAEIIAPPADTAIPPVEVKEGFKTVTINGFTLKAYDTLPDRPSSGRRKYPFDQMQPGQFFFVPNENEKDDASKRVGTAASAASRKLGKRFSVRSIVEEGVKGAGIYCLAPDAQD